MESGEWKNKLYFGDNLDIMRKHLADESVDLIYLDPPFNSKATYNILFGEVNGTQSSAQITAFEDTWHWGTESEQIYHELVTQGPKKLADLIQSMRSFLGTNDMMAYLVMMAIRLIEMYRVLKETGSIYLHCDPSASHYIKLLLDAVFGAMQFLNEIVWYYGPKATQRSVSYQRKHDIIFYYAKEKGKHVFTSPLQEYSEGSLAERDTRYKYEDEGGKYRLTTRRKTDGTKYRAKVYLREGVIMTDVWILPVINATSKERLGYPTQKPEALLDLIITASSKKGDLIMDPFCGCGTTIAVAERLGRRWIGIDITNLAVALMKNRLEGTFKHDLSPYEILGDPTDLPGARALAEQDKYQFEWWALRKIGARPAQDKKKGSDSGIDGFKYFIDDDSGIAKKIIIQVKGGHVSVSQIRDLKGVVEREKAVIGVFISLQEQTRPMKEEAAASGFYEPKLYPGNLYPRIQIITIEELMNGKQIEYPHSQIAKDITFKTAERINMEKKEVQGKLF